MIQFDRSKLNRAAAEGDTLKENYIKAAGALREAEEALINAGVFPFRPNIDNKDEHDSLTIHIITNKIAEAVDVLKNGAASTMQAITYTTADLEAEGFIVEIDTCYIYIYTPAGQRRCQKTLDNVIRTIEKYFEKDGVYPMIDTYIGDDETRKRKNCLVTLWPKDFRILNRFIIRE